MSFFPFNILVVPLIPLILKMRSPKLSNFILKIQYGLLMINFSVLALVFLIMLIPLFFFKSLLNSIFI